MYVDKLDRKISESFYERKAGEWRAEQDRIAEAIQKHRRADRGYIDTGVELFKVASDAAETFLVREVTSGGNSSSRLFRTPPERAAGWRPSSTSPSI